MCKLLRDCHIESKSALEMLEKTTAYKGHMLLNTSIQSVLHLTPRVEMLTNSNFSYFSKRELSSLFSK